MAAAQNPILTVLSCIAAVGADRTNITRCVKQRNYRRGADLQAQFAVRPAGGCWFGAVSRRRQ